MSRTVTVVFSAGLAMLIAGCAPAPDDNAGGGLNKAEAEQLDRAAARIDARPPSPSAEAARAHETMVAERLQREQMSR